jgi:hypothetical protein
MKMTGTLGAETRNVNVLTNDRMSQPYSTVVRYSVSNYDLRGINYFFSVITSSSSIYAVRRGRFSLAPIMKDVHMHSSV